MDRENPEEMASPWSVDVKLMVSPFLGYEKRSTARGDRGGALAKAAFLLLVVGAFVSLTSAGRLVAFHVASSMFFWSFLPALQALAVAVAWTALRPNVPLGRALSLYFDGHGPWFCFLIACAGLLLFAPEPYQAFRWLLSTGLLPIALLVTLGWGGVLTFACFRSGLAMTRGRAAGATAIFYAAFVGSLAVYYLATNQIQPQFPGIP